MSNNENCQFTGRPYDCKYCEGHEEDWTGKGNHTIHVSYSVGGSLRNNRQCDWAKMAKNTTRPDGSYMTGYELHAKFLEMYRAGIEVIRVGECDRFCFKNGCQGHQTTEEK